MQDTMCVTGKSAAPRLWSAGKALQSNWGDCRLALALTDAPCLAQKLSRLHKSILQTANPWWPSHKWVLKGHKPAGCSAAWLWGLEGREVLAEGRLVLLCPWVCGTTSSVCWTEPQTPSPTAESPPVPATWLQRGFVLWD